MDMYVCKILFCTIKVITQLTITKPFYICSGHFAFDNSFVLQILLYCQFKSLSFVWISCMCLVFLFIGPVAESTGCIAVNETVFLILSCLFCFEMKDH